MNTSANYIAQTIVLLLIAVFITQTANAAIQCSCPEIPADGEGHTSCSVSESGGRCTIDYNLFRNREVRAAQMIGKIVGIRAPSFPNLGTNQALDAARRQNMLPELILVYLAVAAVDQSVKLPDTVPLDEFNAAWQWLSEKKEQINVAFSSAAARNFSQMSDRQTLTQRDIIIARESENIISYGCVELRLRNIAVMFKANWSPARRQPRCAPAR